MEWSERSIILPSGDYIKFEPHQKRILEHLFTFGEDGKIPYSLVIYSCVKKSGKTTLNAIINAYWAFNIEAPNELIMAANKLEQVTSRAFRELKGYIERNPKLLEQTERLTEREIKLTNGTVITAIPNDAAGQAGANQAISSFDELWGYTLEASRRLWEELTPVATRLNSFRLVTTYAGYTGESLLLEELYKEIFNEDNTLKEGIERPLGEDFPVYKKGKMFCYWDTEQGRMPWQDAEYYEDQKIHLRKNAYLRLHHNLWVSSETGLFNMEKWDRCVEPEHKPPLPNKDICIRVGVDASVKKDRSAVVSVYREDGIVKLGPKRFWQPTSEDPMDLEETMEKYLQELYDGYTLLSVRYDPFQFHRSAMTLSKRGLPMQEYPQTSSNLTEMGQNLYDLVEYGNIKLYACKDMRYEATCAMAKETGRGLKITKEKSTQKIDQIVALAMASLEIVKSDSLFSRIL